MKKIKETVGEGRGLAGSGRERRRQWERQKTKEAVGEAVYHRERI